MWTLSGQMATTLRRKKHQDDRNLTEPKCHRVSLALAFGRTCLRESYSHSGPSQSGNKRIALCPYHKNWPCHSMILNCWRHLRDVLRQKNVSELAYVQEAYKDSSHIQKCMYRAYASGVTERPANISIVPRRSSKTSLFRRRKPSRIVVGRPQDGGALLNRHKTLAAAAIPPSR